MNTLTLELARIIEHQSFTALVQTLAMPELQRSVIDAPCLGVVSFNGTPLVFTDSGAYADLPSIMRALDEIGVASSQYSRG